MKGSTNAKSTYIATSTAAAEQCRDLKELLLSDRWFSWDYPIEADIGLNESSGLVQEVKRFMVEYGPAVRMPSPPQNPDLVTSVKDRPKEFRKTPLAAQAQIPAGIVEQPLTRKAAGKSTARSVLARLLIVIAPVIVCLIGANAFFRNNFLETLPLFIIFASIMIIAAFKVKPMPTVAMERDEAALNDKKNWPETLEHYANESETFQKEAECFRIRFEEAQRKLSEYKRVLNETVIYEQRMAEYRNKQFAVLKARERLWQRTRLCMQCGRAYLGFG
jgi:hypothetical protein